VSQRSIGAPTDWIDDGKTMPVLEDEVDGAPELDEPPELEEPPELDDPPEDDEPELPVEGCGIS